MIITTTGFFTGFLEASQNATVLWANQENIDCNTATKAPQGYKDICETFNAAQFLVWCKPS